MPTHPSLGGVLRAVATTVVPESSALDGHGWTELENTIESALAERDERTRRQLAGFLRALEVLSLVRYGRPFTKLGAARRASLLSAVERSRFLLVRRGFWGLRTLIFMGYYAQPEIARAIGYRADPRGWTARGGTGTSVPVSPPLWVEP